MFYPLQLIAPRHCLPYAPPLAPDHRCPFCNLGWAHTQEEHWYYVAWWEAESALHIAAHRRRRSSFQFPLWLLASRWLNAHGAPIRLGVRDFYRLRNATP